MEFYYSCFYIFASIAILAAGILAFSKKLMVSLFALTITIIMVAMLWLLMKAEFLGLLLLLLYVGAIVVLFGIMAMMVTSNRVNKGNFSGVIYAGLLAVVLIDVLNSSKFFSERILTFIEMQEIKAIGVILFTKHLIHLEVVGMMLLLAIIAAVMLLPKVSQQVTKK